MRDCKTCYGTGKIQKHELAEGYKLTDDLLAAVPMVVKTVDCPDCMNDEWSVEAIRYDFVKRQMRVYARRKTDVLNVGFCQFTLMDHIRSEVGPPPARLSADQMKESLYAKMLGGPSPLDAFVSDKDAWDKRCRESIKGLVSYAFRRHRAEVEITDEQADALRLLDDWSL